MRLYDEDYEYLSDKSIIGRAEKSSANYIKELQEGATPTTDSVYNSFKNIYESAYQEAFSDLLKYIIKQQKELDLRCFVKNLTR